MKYFSCQVKCGTCGKVLGQAKNVPQDQCVAAVDAASTSAMCPGHIKNVNLDFAWEEQPGLIEAPPPAPEPPKFPNGMINMPDDPSVSPQGPAIVAAPETVEEAPASAPRITADGIALEDLEEAAGEPLAMAPGGEVIAFDKDTNGAPVPLRVIGKNAPRPDQVG